MLLTTQWVTNKIKEIKKFLETNENEHITTQNLWDRAKAVLKGNFRVLQAYLKKQEKSQINNLTVHLKELYKQLQTKPRVNRRREIIKIRVEIKDIETKTKQNIWKINETRNWFLEKINTIDETLTRFIKKKERIPTNTIRNGRGEITTDITDIQGTVRK